MNDLRTAVKEKEEGKAERSRRDAGTLASTRVAQNILHAVLKVG